MNLWLFIFLAVVMAFLLYMSWRELNSLAQKAADEQYVERITKQQRLAEIEHLRKHLDMLASQCVMSYEDMRRYYDSQQTCNFCQCENRTCAGFVRHAGTAEVLREEARSLTAEKKERKS